MKVKLGTDEIEALETAYDALMIRRIKARGAEREKINKAAINISGLLLRLDQSLERKPKAA